VAADMEEDNPLNCWHLAKCMSEGPHMSILDVGCGPGSITIDLARKVPQGHVVGVEYVSVPGLDLRYVAGPGVHGQHQRCFREMVDRVCHRLQT
jgi:SAM-dependent methyltransferase